MGAAAVLITWWRRLDPRLVDALLAVAMAAVTVGFALQYSPPGWPRFDAQAIGWSLLANLPLALRRRAPIPVLAVTWLGLVGYTAAGYQPSANVYAPLLALYTVAALRPVRVSAVAAAVVAPGWFYAGYASHVLSVEVNLGQVALAVGVAWVFGNNTRKLTESNVRLAELTAQLRREQQQRERQAVVEERLHIARELHDVVAHHMSVIAVQAGLARYVFDSDRPTASGALDTIADTTREALAEMRRLLVVLRIAPDEADGADAEPYDAAPDLDRVDALVARVRGAGAPVELVVTGDRPPLSQGLETCAYRVIQEALTNVLKHAGPVRTIVTIHYTVGEITVRIVDEGPTVYPVPGSSTTGHGLLGMRERARIYGGTLRAGPRPAGGFEVVLTAPVMMAGPGDGPAPGT
ncbi:sensor histidine kinase [Krasilnikovia sp. M28-CT-15]|uniref:sensor histidine kinase n=1 Tax=Krasilnikovia sp. M28-CT-15 TaxID=3373540 RepID=UPI003876D351